MKPLILDSIELTIESILTTISISLADISTYILSITRPVKLPK